MKGRGVMDRKEGEKALRERIRNGKVSRADVTRRLAELAFGKANDCVRLALEDDPKLGRLDLSLLSEVKRNDKGTVEIKLIDRLRALEQLAAVAEESGEDLEAFLRALQGEENQ
ncbi:MAG: XRE family transcriptional regulator [Ruminococcaceae bacterium]|nr:XRE family transcriptional regulator [Oscillospiraceae bacterium]